MIAMVHVGDMRETHQANSDKSRKNLILRLESFDQLLPFLLGLTSHLTNKWKSALAEKEKAHNFLPVATRRLHYEQFKFQEGAGQWSI
jgi:hypothetical protein